MLATATSIPGEITLTPQ